MSGVRRGLECMPLLSRWRAATSGGARRAGGVGCNFSRTSLMGVARPPYTYRYAYSYSKRVRVRVRVRVRLVAMRTDLFDPQPFNLPTHAGPHPHGDDRRWHRPALLAGVLAVVAVRLAWGHSHCAEGLPFYSIDENDVVEPTAGFLMGDWNHQYYAYGPVFMYLLSSVYGAAAFLSGHGVHRFATDVFFDPYWHYYLARMLSLIVILATVAVAVLETQRIFSSLAAVICLVVLAFPVAEN